MSVNPELEPDEEQVNLDPDPAIEEGLGEDDFKPFDHRDSYSDVDPNYTEIVDPGDETQDGDEEDLTDEEVEPPEEDSQVFPFWVSYELHGRNLDAGSAWEHLATEPFAGELTVDVEGLTAGASWEFRIRLVDRNGQRSRWSDPLQMSLPTDFTPPPAPTAPDVDENMGYITAWWDGSLTGPTPEDMSHVALHVQQMHPPDDPDGEPGDPYQVGTLSEAGSLPVGFLLVGVLYRAYLTAVDTSGNASPWSDMAEFTPTEAFGTEELEAELEKLNQETLPELEQSLTTKADAAAQAVQDFREEWDENWDPEAIDELRGRADATEAEVATAKAEAEQAKQDAATAQANAEALEGRADATDAEVAAAKAEAEQAKQDAEAAQAKADAVEARADGLESALAEKAEASELNELDGILRGSVDLSDQVADKFYGNMAVVSRLQAEEGWIGGVALGDETVTARHVNMQDFTASQGFIDHAFVNLIQGKQADFEAAFIDSFIAESATVARQIVAARNLYNDPNFEKASSYWNWDIVDGGLERNGASGLSGTYADNDDMLIPAQPGERFEVSADISFPDSDGGTVGFYFRSADADGNYISGTASGSLSSSSGHHRTTVAAHEDAAYIYIGFYQRDVPSSNRIRWENPRVQSTLDGRMVIDGLLQATTGQLEELFFDTAVGNAISLGVADIIEINADRIRSNSWTGQTLTGATIQTHSGDEGVKIHSNGTVTSRDVFSGDLIFRLSAVAGNLFSGRLQTNISDTRGVEIDEGEITWESMLEDRQITRNSPFIRLRDDSNTTEAGTATIALLNAGNMLIAPGGTGSGKVLQVDGMISGSHATMRDNFAVLDSSGDNLALLTTDELSLGTSTTSLTTSSLRTSEFAIGNGAGLVMDTTSSAQPAGVRILGPRTYVMGRTPDGHSADMMYTSGSIGSMSMSSSTTFLYGSFTYGAPAPNGSRTPNVGAHGNGAAFGARRGFAATSYDNSGSSFEWSISRTTSAGSNRVWLIYLGVW